MKWNLLLRYQPTVDTPVICLIKHSIKQADDVLNYRDFIDRQLGSLLGSQFELTEVTLHHLLAVIFVDCRYGFNALTWTLPRLGQTLMF